MYKLIGQNSVKRLSDGAYIPFVDENKDYEEYKFWLKKKGNTPEPEFIEEEVAQQETQKNLQEARYLLDSTQFKFGEDYDIKYTPEWEELKVKRQQAREFIRANQ